MDVFNIQITVARIMKNPRNTNDQLVFWPFAFKKKFQILFHFIYLTEFFNTISFFLCAL